MDILWFLLIGLAAGFLAGAILKGRGFGFVGNLIVGVLGALAGGFLFRLLGLATTNILGSLISATVGAIVVLLLVSFISKRT
ncbi:MAG: GlsB/YeaQ/YmgE family stress response membrane protein [Phycisphaerales bacterium]